MNKEIVTKPLIEQYLTKLAASFGVLPAVSEEELRRHYTNKDYRTCISILKKHLGLKNTVKLTAYPDHLFPDPNASAIIHFNSPLPDLESEEFRKLVNRIEMRKSVLENFHTFIACTVHELCHLILHGNNHELKRSELATDLCVYLFGFAEFYRKGRSYMIITQGSTMVKTTGYLSEEEMRHAILHSNYLRTYSPKRTVPLIKREPTLNDILKQIRDLF